MKYGKKATCAIVSAAALILASGSMTLSASEQTLTPADYYTVCNTMSNDNDLAWKNVQTEFVEGVLDESCLKFVTSDAGRQLNFPIHTEGNETAMADAESVVFWIKTPDTVGGEATTDPDALKMFMNVFDTIDGKRVERSRVSDGKQNLTLVSTKDGTVQTQPLAYYLKIPTAFEGYVILPASEWKDFTVQYFSEVQIWYDGTNETFLLDNIGVTSDMQACISGLSELYTPDEGGEDDGKVDHTTHPDNKNMSVACGLESLEQVGYSSVPVKELSDISPDGSCLRFRPANAGGELNFNLDSNKEAFKDAEAIVFWVKIPDVAEPAIHMAVYDQRPDLPRKQFGLPNGGYSIRTVSTATGEVKSIDCGWYINIPANFEGYVIIDKASFSYINEGNPGDVFSIEHMTQLKWYFEGGTVILPNITEDYYIDDIGVTGDADAYIAGLKELYGGEAKPEDHSKHPDNKGVTVVGGFETDIFGQYTSDYIETGLDTTVSPDKSAGWFTLDFGTQGEVYVDLDYKNSKISADAESIIFWTKTPDLAPGNFFLDVSSVVNDETGAFRKFTIPDSEAGVDFTFISAADGTVTKTNFKRGFQLPGNFEGYVIVPANVFTQKIQGDGDGAFDITKWSSMTIRPDWGQDTLVNEKFYIDDIGVVKDVDAVIENLAKLYEKEPTEPENPGEPEDPDENERPAYEEGPLAPTEGYTVKSVEAAGKEARLTWESVEGVDKYVVHLYRLGKGDGNKALYTYVETFTADEGASSIVLTGLTALTDYAAQLVAMTSTDEIIFAYEPKSFRTLEPGVELPEGPADENPSTGVALPAAAILLGLAAAGSLLVLRRKAK